ncbi:hypothetical protein ACFCV9_28960 [Streptomyces sp. NPDC056367]|uniref:hypothetical protein n=1 Tax=Streptomyces sp. NPDC056367 TaxID=3345797 RepID=UPI0035E1696E
MPVRGPVLHRTDASEFEAGRGHLRAGEVDHGAGDVVARVPVPQDLDDLAAAVETALKGFGRERTALKKQCAPVNWLRSDSAATVNHL